MSKLKVAILVILAIILADFALENGTPVPELKLFKQNLGQAPTFLFAYISLVLGLLVGWVGHALRLRKKQRAAAAAAAAQTAASTPEDHESR